MKSKLLLLIAILCSAISQAQVGNFGVGTSTPGSKLTLNGSFAAPYKIITANGTIGANDFYTASNSASADTLKLPAATVAAPAAGNILGRTYHFKNTGTGILTIAANGSELIDNQSGAGVTSVNVSPGFYAMLISKGTTGAVTTWELVLVASATEAAKPQMAVVSLTAGTTGVSRGAAGNTTAINNDTLLLNTITGATYTPSVGATAGFIRVPAGTYLVTLTIEGNFGSGTTAALNTTGGTGPLPVHSFFYDFPVSSTRIHGNTTSNFGNVSNFGLQIQNIVTVASTSDFKFRIGWGQGGNVTVGSTYDIGKATQLSVLRVL